MPPPRTNLIRYHGVLASAAADRAQIVPGPSDLTATQTSTADAPSRSSRRHRVEWAKLLARVFQVDVTCCPDCGGTMKVIAALLDPASITKLLDALGLPSRAPPIAPPRYEQLELDAA